jgi:hypothetical protein
MSIDSANPRRMTGRTMRRHSSHESANTHCGMAVQFLPTVHKGNTFAREFHSAADKNLLSHDITMSYKNAYFVGGKSHSSHFGGLGLNVGYY